MAQSGRSIAEYMALVALIAFDCVMVRFAVTFGATYREIIDLLLIGVLPMGNILAIGLLPRLRGHAGSQLLPFRAGFLAFGGAAWLLLCIATLLAAHPIHIVVDAAIAPFVRPSNPKLHIVLPLFLLPQLSFALLGGWLNRRYRITIPSEQREAVPAAGPRVVYRVTIQIERRFDVEEPEPAANPRVVVQGNLP